MKIAVACDDSGSLARHFGRCAAFHVFTLEEDGTMRCEVRAHRSPERGGCRGDGHHDAPHTHTDLIRALRDCDCVLCRGMGWRAARDLADAGIRAAVVAGELTPEEAARQYACGRLPSTETFCAGHK